MKKNLEKIFATCSIVVAIILIMVLVVTAFGGIDATEFDSKLVRGLIITLAILYLVLSVITLVLIFVNSDVLKDITLREAKGGSVRVTAQVVTKFVKTTCKQIEGVKCQKVALVSDEYGVRLKVNVKVVDKDVLESEMYLRTLLEDVFLGEFGFKFSSIEIKVMALTPRYKADQADVQAKVEKKLAEMKAKEEKTEQEAQPEESEQQAEEVELEQVQSEQAEGEEAAEEAQPEDGEVVEESETVEGAQPEEESEQTAEETEQAQEVETAQETVAKTDEKAE